jgi:hypothetical protein
MRRQVEGCTVGGVACEGYNWVNKEQENRGEKWRC